MARNAADRRVETKNGSSRIERIRNFSIVAHIDHGKSTLSNALVETCRAIDGKSTAFGGLDSMELEREKGITIKAQSVVLAYRLRGKRYTLNLIDTPGHIDFSHEVSRSLQACEGALLVVDATKGVQAQTIAHYNQATRMGLRVIPVLNKIDLPTFDLQRAVQEMQNVLSVEASEIVPCSSKTGAGIFRIFERIIDDVPCPDGSLDVPFQAIIIDSWFDRYFGVVSLIRIKNGFVKRKDRITVVGTNRTYRVECLGVFSPEKMERNILSCGEVGWLTCSIKDTLSASVGNTLALARSPVQKSLPPFEKIQPKVYAGLFPTNENRRQTFRDSLRRLGLNDSALSYEPENSMVLGCGFRCGFLGLLHMEIVCERLRREYHVDVVTTTPSVTYQIETKNQNFCYIHHPRQLPSVRRIRTVREPMARCCISSPTEHVGRIMTLCFEKRGKQIDTTHRGDRVSLVYRLPLSEVVLGFFDRLNSLSHGYASLDYEFCGYRKTDVVPMEVWVNHRRVDALSSMVFRADAVSKGRKTISHLAKTIPSHQFDVILQIKIQNKIILRATVKRFRKNVLEKCRGGDVTRKKKLLRKQAIGKKRMQTNGIVKIPPKAFLSIFQLN